MEGKMLTVFFALSTLTLVQVSGESNTYVGAVVEYSPFSSGTEEEFVKQNVLEYTKFMKQAKERGADIIVFPENGLGTMKTLTVVPHPAHKIAPCDDLTADKILRDLSKASKDNGIYSVVNLREKRICEEGDENCPSVGYYKFNTNVVFDRYGVVIARYAKYNLYDEKETDKPPSVEISIFDTDFGVRFGTFTCFDILFAEPAQLLIDQYGVTDFVFPTHWFSELPFLTALQTQRGWAETHNVNLLASGVSNPSTGSGGSGIYNGKFGTLVEIMAEKKVKKLLVASVPKINRGNGRSQKRDKREAADVVDSSPVSEVVSQSEAEPEIFNFLSDQIQRFNSEVVNTDKVFEKSVCSHNDFCCSFKVNAIAVSPKAKNYTYRAVAYNGIRRYGESFLGGIQVCGLILCNGPHLSNCTSRVREIPGLFKFNEIEVRGRNFRLLNSFQMPSTISDGNVVRPLPANKYIFNRAEGKKSADVSLELIWPVTDLHTFGIYGRDFTRDNENPPVAAASFIASLPTLLTMLAAYLLFLR